MIKNLILKFNNFIQWTKKWHVCHIYVNIFIFLFYATLISEILNKNFSFYKNLLEFMALCAIALYYMLYWSYTIVLVVSIISHIKKKQIFVKHNFLILNKWYNIHYSIACFVIILCFCVVCFSSLWGYSLIFIIIYIVSLALFLIIKWIITSIIDLIVHNKT